VFRRFRQPLFTVIINSRVAEKRAGLAGFPLRFNPAYVRAFLNED
jgi:hypothetical protein